jgi:hypothetical protein
MESKVGICVELQHCPVWQFQPECECVTAAVTSGAPSASAACIRGKLSQPSSKSMSVTHNEEDECDKEHEAVHVVHLQAGRAAPCGAVAGHYNRARRTTLAQSSGWEGMQG